MQKKIASIRVIDPGSGPDVDSDFNTEVRPHALQYVTDLYGNVANIVTFNTMAAKGAFKALCTLYRVPFAQATKIASLIPGPIDGVDCTIEDLYNPESLRYPEGADFRAATAGEDWKQIIDGAKALSGRNNSSGVHPCGVVISSKPFEDIIPIQVRQSDGRVVTQWNYEDCESLGLIKMDFLGLDTVDLIQHTVENIMAQGKTPPNMLEIMHGPMDDKKTYDMIGRGETIGIFQLAGDGVRDLLRRMKPTAINDIIATTALFRPGPMGMNSHVKYADRKNGREEVVPIHPEFKGSALDEILGETYSLIVYQEQILKIANVIAGMTLQEGDDLRKAMGKKKVAVMERMKPKFFNGAMANGFSEQAVQALWDTIETFAQYGFNKAHSVAYAINAYQAAYLKTHYPVEFMAALIAQHVGNKEKILAFLPEARRMGLNVGALNVNESGVRVQPASESSEFDIVYGFSGVNSISEDVAKIIVDERNAGGEFKSPQDFVRRCFQAGITNKKVYTNVALAGGFDAMGVTRRSVVEKLGELLNGAKTKATKGRSLFDMLGSSSTEAASVEVRLDAPEYDFAERLQLEASVIGLYLTGHPLDKAGAGLKAAGVTTISEAAKLGSKANVLIAAAITDVERKSNRRGGKTILLTLDDGSGYLEARLSPTVIRGLDKSTAQRQLQKLYRAGEVELSDELRTQACDSDVWPVEPLEKNKVYLLNLLVMPSIGDSPMRARVESLRPLVLASDGQLPIRLRVPKEASEKLHANIAKRAASKAPGDTPIWVATVDWSNLQLELPSTNAYKRAAFEMRNDQLNGVTLKAADDEPKMVKNLRGELVAAKKGKAKAKKTEDVRSWPPAKCSETDFFDAEGIDAMLQAVESLDYVDSGYTASKSVDVKRAVERFLGTEGIDFGIAPIDLMEE